METVTVAGKTYIVSLSPQATVLEIEVEGPGGAVTATSFETLFPATNTRGTVYMTATDKDTAGTPGAQASRTSTAGPSASTSTGATGVQSAAASAHRLSSATTAVAMIAGGSLIFLAVWL